MIRVVVMVVVVVVVVAVVVIVVIVVVVAKPETSFCGTASHTRRFRAPISVGIGPKQRDKQSHKSVGKAVVEIIRESIDRVDGV